MSQKRASSWARRTVGLALLASTAASGCAITEEPKVSYIGKASLNYYEGEASEIAYPLGAEGDVTPVMASEPPRTITDRRKDEIWDMTLTEALHCALTNSEIIRSRVRNRGQNASSGLATVALINPNAIPSIYDPAIQETGVLFGGRGVEAALAAFDANFTTSMLWGRNASYQNNEFLSGFGPGFDTGVSRGLNPATVLTQETGAFQSGINKPLATGGNVGVYHNWNYLGNNLPGRSQLFQSAYTGATGVNFTQPLWAASGVEFTRIAGASNPNFSAITGVSQGVLIARINNDITLADFEIAVRTLLKDVEDVYWNLYLAYRSYDVAIIARNSALRSWREAKDILEVGGLPGFRPADEAQARDRYFETRAQVETALNAIYLQEAELRRLMGLPPNDGRVIRPVEEPTTTKLVPDWHACLADAMMFRTELRRQKWRIKNLQLQLTAAQSLTNPQLNFVSGYQINAFGDDLLASDDNDGQTTQGLGDAYGTLLNGEQTGWNLGLQFSMPIGFRQAKTQVRNLELRLAKARAVLSAQELDISHEVADALQAISFQYQNAVTNFNRRAAAAERVELFEQEFQAGTVTLDEVLRAQASLATAESAFYTSLVQYNQSLSYLHVVKGTLLERDNVDLEEGGWAPKAYEQALRKAWHRSYAFPNPLQEDVPPPFAIPDESRRLVPVTSDGAIEVDLEPLPSSLSPVPPAPSGEDASETTDATDNGDEPTETPATDQAAPSEPSDDEFLTPVPASDNSQALRRPSSFIPMTRFDPKTSESAQSTSTILPAGATESNRETDRRVTPADWESPFDEESQSTDRSLVTTALAVEEPPTPAAKR